MHSVEQGGIKYHFLVIGMTQLGIESRSSNPLTNTLTIITSQQKRFFTVIMSKIK